MTDAAYTTPPAQARADPLREQEVGQQTPHYARDDLRAASEAAASELTPAQGGERRELQPKE